MNSRIAQTLRGLSLNASMESDVDASVTTGDGDQTVKVALEQPEQTPADGAGAPGEDKDLTTKTVDVDNGPDTESAETTVEVSLEGLSTATRAKIRRYFGTPLYTGKLYERIEKIDAEIKEIEDKIAAVERVKSVSTENFDELYPSMEGAKWEGVKADLKANWGFMPDPNRPGHTKWSFFGSPLKLAAAKAEELEKLDAKKAELEAKLQALLEKNKNKVSQESQQDIDDVEGDLTTGGGEETVKVDLKEPEQTPADGAGAPGEDKDLSTKIVDVDNGGDTEAAETTIEEAEFITISTEGLLEVSQEGFTGAVKGFAIGTAGVLLAPLTLGLSNGAVDAAMKTKRQRLGAEINQLAKRLADLRNGDIEQAKKDGVRIKKEDLEPVNAGTVVKSFLFGMILPFYSTYQGSVIEELEVKLAAKVAELKIEMARNGISTEGHQDLEVSMEGIKGALKGFLLGGAANFGGSTAGGLAGPVGAAVGKISASAAVDSAMKVKRERLKKEIEQIAQRIAQIKNGDIEEAKKKGIKVGETGTVDKGTVIKSALLGNLLPFYTTYQGHKVEELEIELASKITELKIAFASQGVAMESDTSDAANAAAVAAAAGVAQGAAAAAEAAAAAVEAVTGETNEGADSAAAVASDAAAEAADEVDSADDIKAIEDGHSEIEAIEGDIADGEAHADAYEQSAATMESLVDALQDAQRTGGMTPQAARFFNIGFESIGIRLTGAPFKNVHGESAIPSMESFGGTMRRDEATNVSMEAAGDWLKKILEVLKKTWAQVKEWVIKFIQAVFDQAARYDQRADKILAAVKGKNEKAKSATVDLGRSGAKIAVGNKVELADLSDLIKICEEAGVRGKAATDAIMAIRNHLKEAVAVFAKSDANRSEEETLDAAFAALGIATAVSNGELRSQLFNEGYKGEDGREGFSTKLLPGNVRLAVIDPSSEGSIFKMVTGLMKGWRVVTVQESAQELGEVPTLATADIARVANDVKKVIAAARSAKDSLKAENIDLTNVAIGEDVSEANAKAIQKFLASTGKSVSNASSSIGALLKYAVGTSGFYLDYAVASLKQYGAVIEGEAAPAKPALAAA